MVRVYSDTRLRLATLANVVFLLFVVTQTYATDPPPLIGIISADTTHVLFGEYLTAPGDVTGDGFTDLLVSNGRRSNYLYTGSRVFDSLPVLVFDSTNPWHVAFGDFDGDGWSDFGIPGRSAFKYKMGIYMGGPQIDTVRDFWFGSDSLKPTTNGAAIDVDLDGHKEFVGDVGGWEADVYRVNPWDSLSWLALPRLTENGFFTFRDMAVGDFNGDGHRDLAIGLPMNNNMTLNGRVYVYFARADFDSLPDLVIQRPDTFVYGYQWFGTIVVSPGDMNGDGTDDLFISSGSDADPLSFLYFGGQTMDDIPDVLITNLLTHAAKAGDLNRDGYADLIASFPLQWDGLGSVYVWYGSPTVDSIPDIRLDNWQYPGYHVEFGRDVVGLGDYNGDGVDDFAFSMYDADTRGLIYIYSGTGQPNDVDEREGSQLPSSIELFQNYPNPFNDETVVSLTLSRRCMARLSVYNALGERVTELTNQVLSAGNHKFSWNGKSSSGKSVSSGVYVFRLESGEVKLTRKAVLLK